MSERVIPNQGETSGDPSKIECPSCGLRNDVTGDNIDEQDEFECHHCNTMFVVTGVDYDVTIYVKVKAGPNL